MGKGHPIPRGEHTNQGLRDTWWKIGVKQNRLKREKMEKSHEALSSAGSAGASL
ncbi:hypothetical protein SRHO_G00025930 [Serrasalmus rhombeus]